MTAELKNLLMGALKSAVGSACGLIIALPLSDPARFSITTLGGWKHSLEVMAITILVGEARFWNQWASAVKPQGGGNP